MAKKKEQKTALQDERRQFEMFYGEESACDSKPVVTETKEEQLAGWDEAIFLYTWFLNDERYSIAPNLEHIALLKQEIQEAKKEKRRVLAS